MKTCLSALALLLALPACAQQATPAPAPSPSPSPAPVTDADPALWVVKDRDTTIYLFGTIHLLKPGLSWFDEAVKAAFDRSGELVIEVVMPDRATIERLVVTHGASLTGPTLTEKLPADKRDAFRAAVAAAGEPIAVYDRMKPWLVATDLTMRPLFKAGYTTQDAPEAVLSQAAKSGGKAIQGLETAERQYGFFGSVAEPDQIRMLTGTIDDLPKAETTMARMVADWSRGDPDALAAEMNEEFKDRQDVGRLLLTERNVRWAAWVKERLARPGTVFVAVGAGHLAGPESVQAQLGKLKVKAKRVKY